MNVKKMIQVALCVGGLVLMTVLCQTAAGAQAYPLTVQSTPPTGLGIGSSTGDGGTTPYTVPSVAYQASVNLAAPATDPTGYTFSQWTLGGVMQTTGQKSITFPMPAAATTAVAVYTVNTYTLTVQSAPVSGVTIGSGTGDGGKTPYTVSKSIAYGTNVNLAAPAANPTQYTFTRWVVNGTPQAAGVKNITFTMPAEATTAVVQYTLNTYALTVQSTPPTGLAISSTSGDGGTTPYKVSAVGYGTSVNLTAPATDPTGGYTFSKWTVSGVAQTAGQKSITFNMPAVGTTAVADYTANTYALTVQSTPMTGLVIGSTTKDGGTTNYTVVASIPYATNVNLTAPANDPIGYTFSMWTVNGAGQTAGQKSITFPMPAGATTAVAQYGVSTYAVTVISSPPTGLVISSTTPGDGGTTNYTTPPSVEYGTSVNLQAPPVDPSGLYAFLQWTVNGAAQTAGQTSITFTVTKAVTAVAQYNALTVQSTPLTGIVITSSTGDGGTTAYGLASVSPEASVNLVAPATDPTGKYNFADWTLNGVAQTAGQNSITFTMPAAAVTAVAQYTVNALTVDSTPVTGIGIASTTSDGGVTNYGVPSVGLGTAVNLQAPPTDPTGGYSFSKWTVNGVAEIAGQRSITFAMTVEPTTAVAQYTVNTYTLQVQSTPPTGLTIGSTTGDGGKTPYPKSPVAYGTTVNLTAPATDPTGGYSFAYWTLNGATQTLGQLSITFPMPAAATTAVAQYTLNTYTLAVNSTPPTGVIITSITGDGGLATDYTVPNVAYGSSVNLAAPATAEYGPGTTGYGPPVTGYTFSKWTVNGKAQTAGRRTITFNMPAATTTTAVAQYTANTFRLTVQSTPPTGVTIGSATGDTGKTTYTKTVACGANVNLAAPASNPVGYTFSNWTVNGVAQAAGVKNMTFAMPAGATTAVAEYTTNTYTLTVQSTPVTGLNINSTTGDGGTTPYTVSAVAYNTPVNLQAPATNPPGYTFSKWTVNGVAKAAGAKSITFTMLAGPTKAVAQYTVNSYALKVQSTPLTGLSMTSTTGDGGKTNYTVPKVTYGSNVTLAAPATDPTGYTFSNWTVNGAPQTIGQKSITFIMPPAATTAVAQYYALTVLSTPPTGIVITSADADDGTTPYGVNPPIVAAGTSVDLVAPATDSTGGYSFAYWTVNGTAQTAGLMDITFTMPTPAAAMTAVAVYTPNLYALTVQSTDILANPLPGIVITSGTGDGGTTDYTVPTVAYASSVDLVAPPTDPSGGYSFSYWTLNGTAQTPGAMELDFTMPVGPTTAVAVYTVNTYTLTVESTPPTGIAIGSGTGDAGSTTYTVPTIAYGTSVDLIAPPTDPSGGYSFAYWTLNGVSQTLGTTEIDFTMPASALTAVAVYTANPYTLTVQSTPPIGVVITSSNFEGGTTNYTVASVAYASNVNLAAPAIDPTGYTFDYWTVGGTAQTAGQKNITFPMPALPVTAVAQYLYSYALTVQSTPPKGLAIGSATGDGGTTNYVVNVTAPIGESTASVDLTAPAMDPTGEWAFSYWTLNGAAQTAGAMDITFTITEPTTAVAEYAVSTYPLTVQSTPPTGIFISSSTGDGGVTNYTVPSVTYGTSVDLTASLTDVSGNYTFSYWIVNGTPQVEGELEITLTMPASAMTAVAVYELNTVTVQSAPPTGIVITSSTGDGGTTNYTVSESAAYGTSVDLAASAIDPTGYTFSYWTVNEEAQTAGLREITFTLTGPTTAVAQYTLNTYTLAVQSTPMTGIAIASSFYGGTTNYTVSSVGYNTTVDLAAPVTDPTGLTFSMWTVNGADQTAGQRAIAFTLTGATTAVAVYTPNTYTLTVEDTTPLNGIVITSSTGDGGTTDYTVPSIAYGTPVDLVAPAMDPTGEYAFSYWDLNGTPQTAGMMEITPTMPAAAMTAVAVYTVATYPVMVQSTPATGIPITSLTDDGGTTNYTVPSVAYGSSVDLLAPPTDPTGGSDFDHWILNGVPLFEYELEITFPMPVGAATAVAVYTPNLYTLTVQSTPPTGLGIGSGTGDGGTTTYTVPSIAYASSVDLVAPAADPTGGYSFSYWTLNGSLETDAMEATFAMPASDTTAVAVYTPNVYKLTVNSTLPTGLSIGSGTGDGGITDYTVPSVAYASSVDLVAPATDPTGGYSFTYWTLNGVSQTAGVMEITFPMPVGAVTAVAVYTLNTYALTVQSTPPTGLLIGSGTGDGGTTDYTVPTVAYGTSVDLVAPAIDPPGDIFSHWTVNGTAQTAGVKEITTTMPASAMTAVAQYVSSEVLTVQSTPPTGVGITSDSGQGGTTNYTTNVASGADVDLLAPATDPTGGYSFSEWSWDGGAHTADTMQITVSMPASALTAVAVYTINSFTLTVQSAPPTGLVIGSGTGDGGTTNYTVPGTIAYGTSVDLVAPAVDPIGYTFSYWTLNGAAQTAGLKEITPTMPGSNTTAVAVYALNTYALNVQSTAPTGLVIGSDTGDAGTTDYTVPTVAYKSSVDLVAPATDPAGYTFANWTLNGNAQTAGLKEITFSMPSMATTAVAQYTLNTYGLTVQSTPPTALSIGSGTGDGGTTTYTVPSVAYGASVDLVAPATDPTGGYGFSKWTLNGVSQTLGATEITPTMPASALTAVAVYTVNTFALTVQSTPPTGIVITSATGDGGSTDYTVPTVAYATSVNLVAPAMDPTGEWTFSYWTLNGVSQTAGQKSITSAMPASAMTAVAVYTVSTYGLTVASTPPTGLDIISDTGDAGMTNYTVPIVTYGTTVDLTAPAVDPTGYTFSMWTVGGVDQTAGVKAITFTMPASATLAMAVYTTNTYALTVQDTTPLNGIVIASGTGDGGTTDYTVPAVAYKTSVDLVAPPTDPTGGYSFSYWTLNGIAQGAGELEITPTMPASALTAVAVYTVNTYGLTVQSTPPTALSIGSGTGDGGTTTYTVPSVAYGASVDLVAPATDPTGGYGFSYWTLNGVSQTVGAMEITSTMPASAVTAVAVYTANLFALTVQDTTPLNGIVIASSTTDGGTTDYGSSVAYAASVNLAAPPFDPTGGYSFSAWTLNGVSQTAAQKSITFTMPAEAVTAVAQYTANILTVQSTPPTGVVIGSNTSDGGTTNYGVPSVGFHASVNLVAPATDPPGYTFSKWTVNGASDIPGQKSITFLFSGSATTAVAVYTAQTYGLSVVSQPPTGLAIGSDTGHGGTTNYAVLNVAFGTSIDLVAPATDPTGYTFADWTVNSVAQTAGLKEITFSMPPEGTNATAHYTLNTYMLTVQSTPPTGLVITSTSGEGGTTNYTVASVGYATVVDLVAPAVDPTGYTFAHWTLNGAAQTAGQKTTSPTMPASALTAVAVYTANGYVLTVNSTPPTGIAITSGTGDGGTTDYTVPGVAFGASVDLVAPAADPTGGYSFSHWTLNGIAQGAGELEITPTMPASALTAVAVYTANTFALTVQSTPPTGIAIGSSTGDGGTTTYAVPTVAYATNVNLVAPAVDPGGYTFAYWTLNGAIQTAAQKSITPTMPASALTAVAVYTATNYTLTVNSTPPTGIAITSGTGDGGTTDYIVAAVAYGASVDLVAPAADPTGGYSFSCWTLNGTPQGIGELEITPTMPASALTAVAVYTANTYALDVQSTPPTGIVITSGTGDGGATDYAVPTVAYASTVDLTAPATDPTGYTFSMWTVGGVAQTAALKSISFTMPASATTAVAVYTINNYTLTVQSTPATGTVITSDFFGGTTDYTVPGIPYETSVDLTAPATDPDGDTFLQWTVNGVAQTAAQQAITFPMAADTTAVAQYTSYTLTVNSTPLTGIAIASDTGQAGTTDYLVSSLPNGFSVDLTAPATDPTGYTFSMWTVAGVGQTAAQKAITLTMTADTTAAAVYTVNTYTLGVDSEPPVGISIDSDTGDAGFTNYGVSSVAYGTSVNLVAPATDPTGYTFSLWTGTVEFDPGLKNITFPMPATDTLEIAQYTLNTYTLTVQSTPPTGIVITSDTGQGGTTNYTAPGVPYETSVDLTAPATDPTGYTFSMWTVAGVGQTAGQKAITLTMTAPTTAVAVYTANTYGLDVQSTPPTGIAITSDDGFGGTTEYTVATVAYNTSVDLVAPATDPAGYTFEYWTLNGTPQAFGLKEITPTMPASALAAVAVYTVNTYALTVNSTPPTGLAITSSGVYGGTTDYTVPAVPYASSVDLVAPAADPTGYTFEYWTLDGTPQGLGVKEITPTMPAAAMTAEAVYTTNTYALDVQSTPPTGIAITSGTGDGGTTEYTVSTVAYGSSVDLVAPPTDPTGGYSFSYWTLDGTPQTLGAMEITPTMPAAAMTAVAVYTVNTFALTVQSTPPTGLGIGSSTGDDGTTPYTVSTVAYLASVDLVAPALDPTGYTFEYWTLNAVAQTAALKEITPTMPASAMTAVAVYTANTYELDVQSTPPTGLIIGSDTGHGGATNYTVSTVAYLSSVDLVAPPTDPTGYTFSNWTVGGVDQTAGLKEITFSMPASATTAVANYTLNTYGLTVDSTPVEGVAITSSGAYAGTTEYTVPTVAYGASVDLVAPAMDPSSNAFVQWTVNGVAQTALQQAITFTMPAQATTAVAVYAGTTYALFVPSTPVTGIAITSVAAYGGTTNYSYGAVPVNTIVDLTAPATDPVSGDTFVDWLVNGVPQTLGQQTIDVTMTSDITAEAVYTVPE